MAANVNVQRLLDNRTPLTARCFVLDDRFGREQVVTIAKLTWRLSPRGEARLAVPQTPIRTTAVLQNGPGSSLLRPSDLCEEKPGTDVLLVGHARAPSGSGRREMEVRLRIGTSERVLLDKSVRVHGPRVWQAGLRRPKPGPADILPEATPLSWENAYGGEDRSDGKRVRDDRNPIGRGVRCDPNALLGTLCPPLEDRASPLGSASPAPAGFGPIPRHWLPRSRYKGTKDERWRRERAPLRPLDFDVRAHSCAPEAQNLTPPLRGDENVLISGVTAGGTWAFALPHYQPEFAAELAGAGEPRALDTHLDTFLIDADEQTVEMTWRARFPLPRKLERLRRIRILATPPLAPELIRQLRDDLRQSGRLAAPGAPP